MILGKALHMIQALFYLRLNTDETVIFKAVCVSLLPVKTPRKWNDSLKEMIPCRS